MDYQAIHATSNYFKMSNGYLLVQFKFVILLPDLGLCCQVILSGNHNIFKSINLLSTSVVCS